MLSIPLSLVEGHKLGQLFPLWKSGQIVKTDNFTYDDNLKNQHQIIVMQSDNKVIKYVVNGEDRCLIYETIYEKEEQ